MSATGPDDRYLPLYEAKMLHHYDHRWATYDGAETRDVTDAEKADPEFLVLPRYWVPSAEVDAQLEGWEADWLIGFRNIARGTDERTFIPCVLPRAAVGHSAPVVFLNTPGTAAALVAIWTSFACDYIVRQKVGGVNMTFSYLCQFAVPRPEALSEMFDYIVPRVLELACPAADLRGFAETLGDGGRPFAWEPNARARIRAELDALMFHMYGVGRDDVAYIMETFPIVKGRDEERFGEYRTKKLVLAAYDAKKVGVTA